MVRLEKIYGEAGPARGLGGSTCITCRANTASAKYCKSCGICPSEGIGGCEGDLGGFLTAVEFGHHLLDLGSYTSLLHEAIAWNCSERRVRQFQFVKRCAGSMASSPMQQRLGFIRGIDEVLPCTVQMFEPWVNFGHIAVV